MRLGFAFLLIRVNDRIFSTDVSLPRREQGVDVLGAAEAEREDAPFAARVVRVEAAPVGVGVEVLEGVFVQMPAVRRIDPAAVAAVVRRADGKLAAGCEHAPCFLAELDQRDLYAASLEGKEH